MAPSPGPITCVFPCSSTRQTVSSADDHLTQRVTSSARPRGVACANQDLLARHRRAERPVRQDFELFDARIAVAGRCRAPADPLAQDAVFERAGPEPHAPFMGNRPGRLRQKQAPARVGKLDAPAAVLLDDIEVIGCRIVAAEREPEPSFAGQRAVARTRVAPLFRQHRLDVMAESSRRTERSCPLPRPWPWPCCAYPLCGDRGLAVVDRSHDAVSDRGDLGIA